MAEEVARHPMEEEVTWRPTDEEAPGRPAAEKDKALGAGVDEEDDAPGGRWQRGG